MFLDYGFHGSPGKKIKIGTYRFLIDGSRNDEYESQNSIWEKKGPYTISEGTHILEWIFTKNTTYPKESTGYLDDFCIEMTDKKPIITAISPADNKSIFLNSAHEHAKVRFEYMPEDDNSINKAILYVYNSLGLLKKENISIKNKEINYFEYNLEQPDNYTWKIEAVDTIGQHNESRNRTLKIIQDELPEITLIAPINMTQLYINTTVDNPADTFENKTIKLEYILKDDKFIKNYTLYIYCDRKLYRIIKDKIQNNFSMEFNHPGNYSYRIVCFDSSKQQNESKNFTFRILPIMLVKPGYDSLIRAIKRAKMENINIIKLDKGDYYII